MEGADELASLDFIGSRGGMHRCRSPRRAAARRRRGGVPRSIQGTDRDQHHPLRRQLHARRRSDASDANDKPVALQIQAGEKVYQDFALTASDVGGHSSRPTHNNPIVRLSAGIARLGAYNFPVALNDATRGYLQAESHLVSAQVAADMQAVLTNSRDEEAVERLWAINPGWNGMRRTTCTATEISGGHAPNALPQHAQANVNCRILPGVPIASVQEAIVNVLGDAKIQVAPTGDPGIQSPPPPLNARITGPVRIVADRIWPGIAIVPTLSTGATDGRFLNAHGVPTYGLSGMFHDAEGAHAHGLNERIRVVSLMNGRRFLYEIVKIYADQPAGAH